MLRESGDIMNFTVVSVGKLKEKYWKDGVSEYEKRLSRYSKVNIIQLEDEKTPDNASEKEEFEILRKEGDRILKNIKENWFVVLLDLQGKNLSSIELADFISKKEVSGVSHICFVIGGSLGVAESVRQRSDFRWSFSNLTFPHQMVRIMLLEQIYRAMRIQRGEPYHK